MQAATAPTGRRRVLILAEAANPEWVSVPLIGWSMSQAIAGVSDAHLVTQIRNRDACLRAGLVEGRDFTAIDTERLSAPIWRAAGAVGLGRKGGWAALTFLSALLYPLFEREVWRIFGADIRAGRYDIVHRVTPVSPAIDSPIARQCAEAGVPFIVGPLNGALAWPKGFPHHQRRERDRGVIIRKGLRRLAGAPKMLRHAGLILCGARSARDDLPASAHPRCVIFAENGIDPSRFVRRAAQDGRLPLRGCFIGRLTAMKGVDLLLEAAAPLLLDGRMTLDLIGDGPDRAHLEAVVNRLGIGDGVTFHGWIEHRRVQEIAAGCHLLTFPSLRDFGGGAVLEGMALGLVPIVLDHGGPPELIDDGIGWRIPVDRPDLVVPRLRDRLAAIAADPAVLAPMSRACLDRIDERFLWPAKARRIAAFYEQVLSEREAA